MASRIGGLAASVARSFLRFDTAQSLTSAQQSQTWQNLGYPSPVQFTTNLNLTAVLAACDLRFMSTATGAATILANSTSTFRSGFRTGTISNETLLYPLTFTVPTGTLLDGTDGGSRTILPFQKLIFRLDTDGWKTIWVDHKPRVLTRKNFASITTLDWAMPYGYSKFRIEFENIAFVTSGDAIAYRVSPTDSTGLVASNNSYFTAYCGEQSGVGVSAGSSNQSYALLSIFPVSSNSTYKYGYAHQISFVMEASYGSCQGVASGVNNQSELCVFSVYGGQDLGSGDIHPSFIRFFTTSGGGMNGNLTIEGVP